jgi:hypothetical protein
MYTQSIIAQMLHIQKPFMNITDTLRLLFLQLVISPSGTAFAGNAICHETDTFNYKRGRKIALHRAMVDAGLKKVVKGRQVIVGDYITLSGESVSGWKDQILSFYRDKPLAELKKTVENEWAFPKEIPDMYIHNVLEGKE